MAIEARILMVFRRVLLVRNYRKPKKKGFEVDEERRGVLFNESGGAELERMDDRSQGVWGYRSHSLSMERKKVQALGNFRYL